MLYCDVVLWCCDVVLWCCVVILCCDVVLWCCVVMLCCDVVCDVVLWCCVVMLCYDIVLCCCVVLWSCVMMLCCDGVWDVVCDGVSGGECCGKVKWMILSCLGVLMTDWRTDGQTDERTLVVLESLSRLKSLQSSIKQWRDQAMEAILQLQ